MSTITCVIEIEQQELSSDYPLPFPGLVGYHVTVGDIDMDEERHLGFLGPPGLVPEPGSTVWQADRIVSWVAKAIREDDDFDEIASMIERAVSRPSSTAVVVPSGRKDVEALEWPGGKGVAELSAPAYAQWEALRLESSLPCESAPRPPSPRL